MKPMTTDEVVDAVTREVARKWMWIFAAGLLGIAFGLVLLANPITTAVALAWLIGIALVINGVGDLAEAGRHEKRWPSYVLGAIWIITGVLAIAWPGVTLLVLARIMGIGFIFGAVAQLIFTLSFLSEIQHRWLAIGAALLNLVGGILVLAWPAATVLVLAIVFGLRVLFNGISTTYFAWSLRKYSEG